MEQNIQIDILKKLQSGEFLIAVNNQEHSGYYCYLGGQFLIISEGTNGCTTYPFANGQALLASLWLSYGTTYLIKGKLYRTDQSSADSRLLVWQLILDKLSSVTDYSQKRLAALYAKAQLHNITL